MRPGMQPRFCCSRRQGGVPASNFNANLEPLPRTPVWQFGFKILRGDLSSGTSSWTAEGWEKSFYTPGTRPSDYLVAYAQKFNTVESVATFYRTPSARTVEGWRRGALDSDGGGNLLDTMGPDCLPQDPSPKAGGFLGSSSVASTSMAFCSSLSSRFSENLAKKATRFSIPS